MRDVKFHLIAGGVTLVIGLFAEAVFGEYLQDKFSLKKGESSEYTARSESTEPVATEPSTYAASYQESESDHNETMYQLATDLLAAYELDTPQETPTPTENEVKPPPTYEEAESYLKDMDSPSWDLHYDGKAVKNEHGYNLNHDGDKDFEWALGKDCDVFSYSEETQGKWLVGRHSWIVIFGDERVAFTKKSLPKNISKKFIENCSVNPTA